MFDLFEIRVPSPSVGCRYPIICPSYLPSAIPQNCLYPISYLPIDFHLFFKQGTTWHHQPVVLASAVPVNCLWIDFTIIIEVISSIYVYIYVYICIYMYIYMCVCVRIYYIHLYIPTRGLVQFPCSFPHISAYFRSHPWPPEVSTFGLIQWLFLPSFVAALVPLLGIWWQASRQEAEENLGFEVG